MPRACVDACVCVSISEVMLHDDWRSPWIRQWSHGEFERNDHSVNKAKYTVMAGITLDVHCKN